MSSVVSAFMEKVKAKNPGEKEFLQAVEEVVTSLMPLSRRTLVTKAKILERMVEPEQ